MAGLMADAVCELCGCLLVINVVLFTTNIL